MADIHTIEENLPHRIHEVMCVECKRRWLAVSPVTVLLRDYECSNGHIGFVVATGCTEIIQIEVPPTKKENPHA